MRLCLTVSLVQTHFKKAALLKISTLVKMCLIKICAKFRPDKNATFRLMFQPPQGNIAKC